MSKQQTSYVPQNPEIFEKLESTAQVLQNERETNPKLDDRGRKVAMAAENMIETSKEMLEDKNQDEKMQKFINHAVQLGERLKNEELQQVDNKQVQESFKKLRDLSTNFRSLVNQMVTSAEYRGMIVELVETVDKLLWRVAKKKGYGGEQRRTEQPFSSTQTNQPTQTGQAFPSTQTDQPFPSSQTNQPFPSSQTGQSFPSSQTGQASTQTGQASTQTGGQTAMAEVAEELTEEEKKKMVRLILGILGKMGRTPQYYQATNNILSLFDYFRSQQQQTTISNDLKNEMTTLYREGVAVIQEFAGNKDLSQLENKFWSLYKVWDEDSETKNYFTELRNWMNRIMSHPDTVDEEQVVDESSRLISKGEKLVRGKYEALFREITNDFKDLMYKLQQDEYTKQYQEHLNEFKEAFALSPFETLSQTRHLIFPVIRELLNDFKLPRIESTTENSTFTIENMALKGNKMNIEDIIVNLRFGLKNLMELTIKVKNISAGAKNADFNYRNTGTFSWSDEGTFDVNVASPSWKIKWVVRERKNLPMRLELAKVDVTLKTFDVTIEEATHKFIDRMLLGMFQGSLRKKAEEELETAIKKQAESLSERFNTMLFPSKKMKMTQGTSSSKVTDQPIQRSSSKVTDQPIQRSQQEVEIIPSH